MSTAIEQTRSLLLRFTGIDLEAPTLAGIRQHLERAPEDAAKLGHEICAWEETLVSEVLTSYICVCNRYLMLDEDALMPGFGGDPHWMAGGLKVLVGREAMAVYEASIVKLHDATPRAAAPARRVRL
ncbi:hypothetical protein [Novilysobacter arseniciresistens]|uniref:hypothetical protein n=1 Tax=Novilysobacter arseniciresistens TaxID=1385522 RepID=UPI0012699A6A|nr:hypothetical protein [Lysobacter arseniciresistens]